MAKGILLSFYFMTFLKIYLVTEWRKLITIYFSRYRQEKRAQYIAKNNELTQEFHYAHPSTKVLASNIFNGHFYGAPLWDLFSQAFQKLEKTWNTSHRLMLSLPLRTHRYLIGPFIGRPHIINSLWKRFLKITNCISIESKSGTMQYA